MSAAAIRLRLRADLSSEQVVFGDRLCWIVRDPVTSRFFYFDEREYSILRALDGDHGVQEILDDIRRRRPDEYLPPEALIRFLAEAKQSGLVVAKGGAAAPPSAPPAAPRFQPLFAQVPLFNPDRLLSELTPRLSFVFSTWFLAAATILALSAALSIGVRFDEFRDRWPSAAAWATPSMLLTTAAVLLICKVFHELSHGIAAKHCGAPVEECGILFLLCIPCFYCDVTEAWMLRSRWKRIMTSAAGMLTELVLASAATWLWWFSREGPLRSVLLAVMVTCSVNTLLINGNPLMRFDGYFIFIDALGLPNLAARGARWWTMLWDRLFWGLSLSPGSESDDWRVVVYGAASLVYRMLVVFGVLWIVHHAARERGLQAVTIVLAILAAAGIARRGSQALVRPLTEPVLRRTLRPGRVIASLGVVAIAVAFAMLQPLPRSIDANFILEPDESTPVFVRAPGQLQELSPRGIEVREGAVIARLENVALRRQLLEAWTEERLTDKRLQNARLRRTADASAGAVIPALVEALTSIHDRTRLLEQDVEDLTIRAPRPGWLLAPPNVVPRTSDSRDVQFWTGTPFDPENRNCYLERGAAIAQIAPTSKLIAVAYVGQRLVERLKPGQAVTLAVDGAADRPLKGTIAEVSASPVEHLPREFVATRRMPVAPDRPELGVPLEPHYRIRVQMASDSDQLIPGTCGDARIRIESASLLQRMAAAMWDAFRFEL